MQLALPSGPQARFCILINHFPLNKLSRGEVQGLAVSQLDRTRSVHRDLSVDGIERVVLMAVSFMPRLPTACLTIVLTAHL